MILNSIFLHLCSISFHMVFFLFEHFYNKNVSPELNTNPQVNLSTAAFELTPCKKDPTHSSFSIIRCLSVTADVRILPLHQVNARSAYGVTQGQAEKCSGWSAVGGAPLLLAFGVLLPFPLRQSRRDAGALGRALRLSRRVNRRVPGQRGGLSRRMMADERGIATGGCSGGILWPCKYSYMTTKGRHKKGLSR